MSIADKLNTVLENTQKVYEAGYNVGLNEGHNVGYDYGERMEYDRFWDSYQNKGERTDYYMGFCGTGWHDETFRPKYNISFTQAVKTFQSSAIVDLVGQLKLYNVTLDFSHVTTKGYETFRGAYRLINVPNIDLRNCTNVSALFYDCKALKTIEGLDISSAEHYNNVFYNCKNLRDITFLGTLQHNLDMHHSPLSAKSLVSVVEHLSGSVTGKTLTLSQAAVNNADWSEAGYSTFDEMIQTKPNWTVSLI